MDQAKNFRDLGLITSSVNDHAHAIRVFMGPEDGPVIVGETSLATGDAEQKEPHAHPFQLNMETGELTIAEADGHVHAVSQEDLSAMLEQARQPEPAPQDVMRSDDRGPGVRQARNFLSNAAVGFVSLCRRGMNGIRTVMKSDGRFSVSSNLSKMDREGLLHTLVWVPDLPCHEGDVMTADEVRKMAHGFLPNGGHIDIEHNGKPLSADQVSIAEHYIVPEGDPKFQGICTSEGAQIDPTGGWGLILKINDPEIRADYESGEWNGVSLAGRAEVTPIGKSTTPTPTPTEDEFDMTPEDRKQFSDELADKIVNGLSVVLKAQTTETPPAEPTETVETVSVDVPSDLDINDPEALEAWADQLYVESLDLTKKSDVEKLAKHRREQAAKRAKVEAQKAQETQESNEGAEGSENETELEKAKRERDEANARIEKLEKASKQSAQPGDEEESLEVANLNKSENSQWKAGLDLVRRAQRRAS